jgi:hypothetical protein
MYNQNNHVKEDEMGEACSMHEKNINAYRGLVGKPQGKWPLGIPRRRWEDNSKFDF